MNLYTPLDYGRKGIDSIHFVEINIYNKSGLLQINVVYVCAAKGGINYGYTRRFIL